MKAITEVLILILAFVVFILVMVSLVMWLDDPDYKSANEICIEGGFDKDRYIEGGEFCQRMDLVNGELVKTYEYLDVVKEQIGYSYGEEEWIQ